LVADGVCGPKRLIKLMKSMIIDGINFNGARAERERQQSQTSQSRQSTNKLKDF